MKVRITEVHPTEDAFSRTPSEIVGKVITVIEVEEQAEGWFTIEGFSWTLEKGPEWECLYKCHFEELSDEQN